MPQLRLTVQTITPLLMYGAHNKDDRANRSLEAIPELRAPSIRGILRYWLRAVLGARLASTGAVFEEESKILGSTDTGSRIRVRVYRSQGMREQRELTVLPDQTRGYPLKHTGYLPDSQFRIVLSTHLLDSGDVLAHDSDLLKAIFLMVHMGGLGRRSRRGSGNLRVLDAKDYEGKLPLDFLPDDRDALVDYLAEISQFASRGLTVGRRPNFPVYAEDTAVVLVGRAVHAHYDEAFGELWSVSGPYHQEGGIFGDVRPRRASAIHMRVAETSNGYIAQQTVLYSGSGQWNRMRDYIEHCRVSGFEAVFGTWEHWT